MTEQHIYFAISSESISRAKRSSLGAEPKDRVFTVEVEVDNTTVNLGVLFRDDLRELASQLRKAANYIDPQEDD